MGLLAAAGLTRILDGTKKRFHTSTATQTGIAVTAMALVIFDFFPRPAGMSIVAPRTVHQWLFEATRRLCIYRLSHTWARLRCPAIYSTRFTAKKIIMGSSHNPPNPVYWSDLSAFPSPFTLDLLYGWGAKYVLVDENLYRAGTSFWNIYQTWDTPVSAIKQSPRLKNGRAKCRSRLRNHERNQ